MHAVAVPGFFSDVRRWNRADTTLNGEDGFFAAYSAVVWIVCMLAAWRSVATPLADSPLRPLATWIFIALTAWMMLPLLQLVVPQAAVRSLLRNAVYSLSLLTGGGCLAYLYGVWAITHTPGLLTSYFREVTLPSGGLILLGLVGLVVSTLCPARSSVAGQRPSYVARQRPSYVAR